MSDPTACGHDLALVRRSIKLSADEGDAAGLQGIAESLCYEVEQRHQAAAERREQDLAKLRRLLAERNDYARRLVDLRDERDAARGEARQVADDHADALSDARAEVARVERERDDLAHAKWDLERMLRQTIRDRDDALNLHTRLGGQVGATIAALVASLQELEMLPPHLLNDGIVGRMVGLRDALVLVQRLASPPTEVGATAARANETAPSVGTTDEPANPVAVIGCDDCSVEPGETHRWPDCPGAERARQRAALSTPDTQEPTP